MVSRKLQLAGENLINIVEKIQASPEFYMRYMGLMKEERELISEKDYKEFLAKNEKVLSRNFEKNAYLALLMQEMEEKKIPEPSRKLTSKDEAHLKNMVNQRLPFQEIEARFPKVSPSELAHHHDLLLHALKLGEHPERPAE